MGVKVYFLQFLGRSCEEMFPPSKRPYNAVMSQVLFNERQPVELSDLTKKSALRTILIAAKKDKSQLAAEATMSFLLDKVEDILLLEDKEKVIRPILEKYSLLVDKHDAYFS